GPTRGDSAVNCNRILKRLDLYAGGDLAGREAAEVELHLRGCLSCYREYVAQRDLLETVRGVGGIEPRGDAERETLVAGVMRRIPGLPPPAPRLLPRVALVSGWAAALLVAVLFGMHARGDRAPRASDPAGGADPLVRRDVNPLVTPVRSTTPFEDEAWMQSQLDLLQRASKADERPCRGPNGLAAAAPRLHAVRDF